MKRNKSVKSIGVLVFAMFAFLIMALAPASAVAGYYTGWEIKNTPSNISLGVKATINTVDPTIAAGSTSSVSYSISVNFASGDWVQFGYLEDYYRPNPRSGLVYCSTPTLYVEHGVSGVILSAEVITLGTVAVGSTHTYDLHWTGMSGALNVWSCYLDGVLKYNQLTSGWDLYPANVNVQGESKHTGDYSTSHAYFNALKYGKWVYPKNMPRQFQWSDWNGYSDAGSDGDWRIVKGVNSMEVWLL